MIRPAVPADLKAVVQIAKQSFFDDDAFGCTWLCGKLANAGTQLYVDDAALSLIRGFLLLETHQLGTIVRLIAVAPNARKQGVGRALLELVKAPAFTWIRDENEASQALFKSMGWVEAEPPRKRKEWRYYKLGAADDKTAKVFGDGSQIPDQPK